jgi:lycopene beta-cyclase
MSNATAQDWDIVIAGGGLAGLALAVELADPAFSHLRVLVLERRTHYERDRTWSFWKVETDSTLHAFAKLAEHRWSQWRVGIQGQPGTQVTSVDVEHPYCTVEADKVYDYAQLMIARAPHVSLRMGVDITSIEPAENDQVRLTSSTHATLNARLLFDGRPVPRNATARGRNSMAQHFLGWEIETDQDVFNDSVVDLMDFKPHTHATQFLYTLPFTPRHALIESTWLSVPGARHDYESELRSYIEMRWPGLQYRIVFQESGVLDLAHKAPLAQQRNIVPIGTRAGTMRSSTGYAFLESLRDARRIAKALRAQGSNIRTQPKAFARPKADVWMDQVFMQVLATRPELSPANFVALFAKTPPLVLMRFMSGLASLADRAVVAKALPKALFGLASLQVMLHTPNRIMPVASVNRPQASI